jgi:hypothetical protein
LSALASAESKIGCGYIWGGKGPDFFDCSVLITWSYRQNDGSITFDAADGFSSQGSIEEIYDCDVWHIGPQLARPGDIVFIGTEHEFISHGGLFIKWLTHDEFSFVDASSYHGMVVRDSFSVSREIRGQRFVGFGRLLRPPLLANGAYRGKWDSCFPAFGAGSKIRKFAFDIITDRFLDATKL